MSHSTFVLVDTNVISYIFKGDSRGGPYLESFLLDKRWAISFMTLAELDVWPIRFRWGGKKIADLNRFMSQYLLLPFDRNLCSTWTLLQKTAVSLGNRSTQTMLGLQLLQSFTNYR